jgi:hypothetical protein
MTNYDISSPKILSSMTKKGSLSLLGCSKQKAIVEVKKTHNKRIRTNPNPHISEGKKIKKVYYIDPVPRYPF